MRFLLNVRHVAQALLILLSLSSIGYRYRKVTLTRFAREMR